MNELLFKLKRNGKTVGYCKWTEDWGWKYSLTADFKDTFTHFAVAQTPQGISAHPYVCKDGNDKDVFAGDKIIASDNGDYFPEEYNDAKDEYYPCGKYEVYWADHCGFWLRDLETGEPIDLEFSPFGYADIELIEEEE